jgi:glucose/arabinose dehydrogenase
MAMLQFAAYIDGSRRVLDGFTCSPAGSDSFDCSAPLPPLTAGRHTLEIASFFNSGTGVVESPRSPALQLMVSGIVAQLPPARSREGFEASDGRALRATVLAGDLIDPADVAVDARGRALVVERRGTLRIVEPESTDAEGVPTETLFGRRDEGARALSIALAPDFGRSGLLYILGALPSEKGSRLFVTRFRELRGTLGEAAVVVSHTIDAEEADGSLRFGPDGAMYIAAGSTDGGSGQILRLDADGRIPDENPGGSPVYWSMEAMPAGLDWPPADLSLWTVETSRTIDRFEVRRRVKPDVNAAAARQPDSPATPRLPRGTQASGLTIVKAPANAFDGDAIVSSIGLADLLRFDGSRAQAPTGEPVRLLQGRFGAIGGVAAAPSGDIYFFTLNNETWSAGRDVLVRLRIE